MGTHENDEEAEVTARLATLIDAQRQEIERRWLAIVQEHISKTPGLEPTHLRDGLPDYLKALVRLLSSEGGAHSDAGQAWREIARKHGITRVRIGFDVNQLIQEFVVLRHVIRGVAHEHGLTGGPAEALLADLLDGAITAAVSAYVDARDYGARQKQAENVGFVTHELRTPLSTAVLAAAQLRRLATPEQQHALDLLDRNHTRLSCLIESVLLTGRLEAGHVEPRPVDVRLEQLMAPALEAARAAALHKGLAFEANYDPDLAVHVDPELTRSALQNLADNAAKYTDRGHVEVTVDAGGEDLVVHVRDTCAGISEAELRTIFEPFQRGTTGKSGTGLGLAIARRAIELQGGSLRAESPGECGCHFWITLPKGARAKQS